MQHVDRDALIGLEGRAQPVHDLQAPDHLVGVSLSRHVLDDPGREMNQQYVHRLRCQVVQRALVHGEPVKPRVALEDRRMRGVQALERDLCQADGQQALVGRLVGGVGEVGGLAESCAWHALGPWRARLAGLVRLARLGCPVVGFLVAPLSPRGRAWLRRPRRARSPARGVDVLRGEARCGLSASLSGQRGGVRVGVFAALGLGGCLDRRIRGGALEGADITRSGWTASVSGGPCTWPGWCERQAACQGEVFSGRGLGAHDGFLG